MTTEVKDYIEFKIGQKLRLLGFDFKQDNAKEKAKEIIKPHLESIVKEALLVT